MYTKTLIAASSHSRDWYSYSLVEVLLVKAFSELNDDGQKKALERIKELKEIPKYQRTSPQDDPESTPPAQDSKEIDPPSKALKGPQLIKPGKSARRLRIWERTR